jgi:arginine repressor
LYIEGIVASIAGDNVVLIITSNEKIAKDVANTIENNLN